MYNNQALRKFIVLLCLTTIMPLTAQTVPPVTTEWKSGLILQNGSLPPASYSGAVSVDSNSAGSLVAVWNRGSGSGNNSHYVGQFSWSRDYGKNWSEPRALLPNPQQTAPLWREVHTVAASENGIWMAAIQLEDDSQQTTSACGIVTSTDFGRTWSDFQDLSQAVGLQQEAYELDLAYCGDSTWIFLLNAYYGVRYIRSTDNGKTWGPIVPLSNFIIPSGAVQGHPNGTGVMITHYDDKANYIVSKISSDHGATFGPPVRATIGATDGAGNWIVSRSGNAPGPIPLLHSADNGLTFLPIPSPPVIDDRNNNPYKLAYSRAGEIVVITYAVTCVGLAPICLDYQSGLITRTNNRGQTWKPWERFGPNAPNTVIPLDVTATPRNNFFAIMNSEPGSSAAKLHTFRLDLSPLDRLTAARDWQLYR